MKAEALIGKVLGTCTLLRLVGQGGMGAVYLAQQSRPRRQVAVKVLLPITELSPVQHVAFLERFRRETDVVASLIHSNIMPVHEYGEQDGLAYLVMPYISGGTLRDELDQQGSLPLTKILYYLDQTAAALDFAHRRGVIHRDVKPANILKTADGRLLLSDFGLVKVVADGRSEQSYVPGVGLPLGTPDYMAPEQGMGSEVDARADLYALGVVLYHMITGDVPFKGNMPIQVVMQHLHVPPPQPRLVRIELPVAAEQVVLRALAKNPAERYASAIDMTTAFRQALVSAGVRLDDVTMEVDVQVKAPEQADGARLFKPRSLFDPLWRSDGTVLAEKSPVSMSIAAKGSTRSPIHPVTRSAMTRSVFAGSIAPMIEGLSTRTAPGSELSVLLPEGTRVGHTPLPPTPLKLTSKGEEPTMLQKHKMLSFVPNTSENQGASSPQVTSAQPMPPKGEITVQSTLQPPAAMPQAAPVAGMPYNFAAANAFGQPDVRQSPPPINNVPGQPISPIPPFAADGARQLGSTMGTPFASNAPRQPGEASMPSAFVPSGGTRKLSGPPIATGNTGYYLTPGATGAFARIATGQTRALTAPNGSYDEQGMTGTMKLTQPVKVVQVPVAGQPGRYMTGFLPVVPSNPGDVSGQAGTPTSLKKKLLLALSLAAVVLVVFGSGLFLLLRSTHQQMVASVGPQGPNPAATAAAFASATAQANTILEDPLTDHIHNWPLANSGPLQYIFKNGAYHVIVNDNNNSALPLLPGETFNGPMAYAVTMQEVRGNDGSPYNWFGTVMRYSEHQQGGRTAKTFYCFDYEPADGIYQFRMYNNSFAASASAWTDIWHTRSGREYHTRHGVSNTIKVFAKGNDFTFFVNGKRVGEARDNSLSGGQIGMVVNQQGAEIAFSNLVLTYN